MWVAGFDTEKYSKTSKTEENNLITFDVMRLKVARTMDERSVLLRQYFGAKFHKYLEEYSGLSYLNEWGKKLAVV